MRVTVFGGAGFLGSHVCDKLSDAGHSVTVFDLVPSPHIRPDQRMAVGDILDESAVDAAVAGADAVYNFAGIADIGEADSRPLDTARYNVLGNIVALEAARKAGVKRFVFASSLYVYSKAGGFYRCSKQAGELFIENYRRNYGLEYTILRYGSLYGPRADRRNAIYRFVREAMETGRIEYFGLPTALREYIHVEDAALCSVEILDPQYADSNIVLTGNRPMRVEDVLKMIGEILGRDIEFVFQGDGKAGHYEITPYSFSPKIGKKMSPRLSTDFGQGILRTIEEVHRQLHPELTTAMGYLVTKEPL